MNNETVFAILLNFRIEQIYKFIMMNSANNIYNEYLWKVLYVRDHKGKPSMKHHNKLHDYYNLYISCYELNNFYDKTGPNYKKCQTNSGIMLAIVNNKLCYLTHEISQFDELSIFKMCSCDMIILCSHIGSLVNLKKIIFEENKIMMLPTEIGLLINLKVLKIDKSNLQYIPSQIGLLKNLYKISVSHNQLKSLPSEIGLLTNINIFRIKNNQLRFLPSEIQFLVNLQWLNISNNKLEYLPNVFYNFNKLGLLYMYCNNFQNILIELNSISTECDLIIDKTQSKLLPYDFNNLNTFIRK